MEPKPNLLIAKFDERRWQDTYIQFTLATAVILALVIFVTTFLFGLWCGWTWRLQRHSSRASWPCMQLDR